MNTTTIEMIRDLTSINHHTEALMVLAHALGDKDATMMLATIRFGQQELGYLLLSGSELRTEIHHSLMQQAQTLYPDQYAAIRAAF